MLAGYTFDVNSEIFYIFLLSVVRIQDFFYNQQLQTACWPQSNRQWRITTVSSEMIEQRAATIKLVMRLLEDTNPSIACYCSRTLQEHPLELMFSVNKNKLKNEWMKIYSSTRCDSGCKKAQEGVPHENIIKHYCCITNCIKFLLLTSLSFYQHWLECFCALVW